MEKTNIKSGSLNRKNRFNLDCSHITTMDFMTLQPIYYRRLIPGQSIKVDVNSFARLADMPCPTFGQARLRVLGFFVPYRTCWRPFNSFIGGTVDGSSSSPTNFSQCAYVYNEDILEWMVDQRFIVADQDDYDFELGSAVGSLSAGTYCRFTTYGRYIYKMLQCLGIQLDFNVPTALVYNALDILSFLRIIIDWLYTRQSINDSDYHQIEYLLTNYNQSNVSSPLLTILVRIFYFLTMPYEQGYFTDMFDDPQGPTNPNSNFPTSVLPSESQSYSSAAPRTVVVNTDRQFPNINSVYQGVPAISNQPNASGSTSSSSAYTIPQLSESMLQNLHALTMYVRRNNIAGSRAYERLYAQFGIKPDSDVFNRSYFLGDYSVSLQVSDVMSTASTDGASLGSYAGKGYMLDSNDSYGTFEFRNESTDFGVFMLVAYIEPKVIYPFGVDGMQLDVNRLDFFHGDFDSIGTQPVIANELFLPDIGNPYMGGVPTSNFSEAYERIIGFTPRYSRYKTSRDWLTGDFRLASKNQAGVTSNQWHFARYLTAETDSQLVVSDNLYRGYDANQFNRIFYNTSGSVDHFVCQFLFKVVSYAPMRPLYDFMEFDDDTDHKDISPEIMGISKV